MPRIQMVAIRVGEILYRNNGFQTVSALSLSFPFLPSIPLLIEKSESMTVKVIPKNDILFSDGQQSTIDAILDDGDNKVLTSST